MSAAGQSAVLSKLTAAGYEQLPQPLAVGGIPFHFTAALARQGSLDLIAIADPRLESDERELRAKVQGLGRALDLLGSRRTLTLIILGPRPASTLTSDLSRVARVLLAGTDVTLADSLAVLMPLALAAPAGQPLESWAGARERLRSGHPGRDTAALLAAAARGPVRVRETLKHTLSEPFAQDAP